jgi:D-alanyl-D-alanine carboxypeptidase
MRLFILAALVGCGGSTETTQQPADTGITVEDTAPVVDSEPSACDLQSEKLQAALETAKKTAPNAVLGIKDPACGLRTFVAGDPANATLTTLWRMGSVTKTFVSAVILSLETDGKLAITDPLSKWIPGVPKTDGVTVRMLLNHTSGIFNYTEDTAIMAERTRAWTPQEIVDAATKNDPYFAPGMGFHYSNTNYVLLGMIAEKAGGAKIGALVRTRALDKAGLKATFFDGEEPVMGMMTKGFTGTKDVTNANHPSVPWAAGMMVATGGDLAMWAEALYSTDKILNAAQREKLTADPVDGYGLGVIILPEKSTLGGGRALGHNGAIDGFHTQMFWFPAKQTAVAAVVNRTGGDPNAVSLAAIQILFK